MKTVLFIVACVTLLSSLFPQSNPRKGLEIHAGGIVRTDRTSREIHLVFTGHEFADGGELILGVLKKHGIKASFFFTGDFYRNTQFSTLISSLKK